MYPIENYLLTEIPPEILLNILKFCESKTSLQVSKTCKKIKDLVDVFREKLFIRVPLKEMKIWGNENPTSNPHILSQLLKRFSNVKHLYFAVSANSLNVYNKDVINPLIQFLKEHYPPQLSMLGLGEIESRRINTNDTARALNKEFFEAFGHPQLRCLTISPCLNGSILNSEHLRSILSKSSNLTSFIFRGQEMVDVLEIPLSLCQKLERIQLIKNLNHKTIEHLKQCTNLTDISIDDAYNVKRFEDFLFSEHKLNLTSLDLGDTSCLLTDEALNRATSKLTNLQFFCNTSENQLSDQGLLQLAKNCKQLKTLHFSFQEISNQGLKDFAQQATQLQKLSMVQLYHINETGLAALAQNCINLKALELVHCNHVNSIALETFTKHCTNLQLLKISNCGGANLQELTSFLTSCVFFKYFYIYSFNGVKQKDINELYKKFSYLKKCDDEEFNKI